MEAHGKDHDVLTEATIKEFFEQMRFFLADAHRRVKAGERTASPLISIQERIQ
jgi:hypothetical protein